MGIIVFLVGFAVVVGMVVAGLRTQKGEMTVGLAIKAVAGLAFVIVLANLAGAIVIVGAGHRVVVFNKLTGVRPTALKEGFNVVLPFVESTIDFDTRVQKADVKASAASKDLQDVNTEVVLNFRPRPEAVAKIYQTYGEDFEAKVIAPAVQESLKAVVATYNAQEIVTQREKLKAEVQEQLSKMMAEADLDLVETYITNFNFSEDYAKAIEEKQVAAQAALRAQNDLARVKFEADQKLAQAEAEAKGLRLQKDAITPELIQLRKIEMQAKAIEKWDGQLPTSMIPGSALPFINLTTKDDK